jgi:gluconolactonase
VSQDHRPVSPGATVELIDSGFEFTEGPLWYESGLLFSDIPANTVYRWTADAGTTVFLRPSGRANGLALDRRHTEDGTITPLVQAYGGRRLNSPNDLTVASDGTIYFTDPPYGVEEEQRRLDFSGVYRLSPGGALTLLTRAHDRPNGIGLAPSDSTLYVSDSRETRVWAYDLTPEGTLENKRVFATPVDEGADGTTDGLAVDAEGHLYTTGPGGVWVYAPDGTRLARIAVPKAPSNLAFGGPNRKTLFITARSHVYRVPVNVPGAP